jgi:seryl-tRNA synthetase
LLDLKLIRREPDAIRAAALKKHVECDVDAILALDQELRTRGQRIDELRGEQNRSGKQMAQASPEERADLKGRLTELKSELSGLEGSHKDQQSELDRLLLTVPNIPAEEVPEGADDSDNVELRTWGEKTTFDFDPRDHVELATAQGWLEIERAAQLSGSRNYVLQGDLALLEYAVMRWALDVMVAKGFTALSVPTLVRSDVMVGTGYFPGGEDQAYRCDERDDLCLVGTSEVPVTALYQGEILPHEQLPKRFVALSTCYRREAGTYGKDTRGLYRVHQFQKVEQVILDVADEARSLEHHLAILQNSEEIVQALELPYRVVNVCGGDLGVPHVQKFDIETWMPSRAGYGETHSASRFHDFQARRLNLRYRDADGKTHFCHTLNNTVCASSRTLLAILENHQNADGTVRIPAAVQPYLGGRETIGAPLG